MKFPWTGWSQMPPLRRRTLLIALALMFACAAYFLRIAQKPPADPIAQFLAMHWAQPIAPQGEPPPGYSAIEASLAPETCAACHVAQYAEWNTSLHSKAMGPGIRWQLRIMAQKDGNECLRCHAPLAEQKALTALEHGWANAPSTAMPAYVSSDLHRRGNTCGSCHMRRQQRFGPPSQMLNPKVHGGFVAQQAFRDSRFCSPCHQFPAGARRLEGKLIENTYEEWRTSPAAGEGSSCQSCHMPDHRHLWRGIHDPETVRKGLRRELEVTPIEGGLLAVKATIAAPGVGHFFPTYVVPKILVSLHLYVAGTDRELTRLIIGRTVSVDMDRELSDTRIPPGGRAVLSAQFATPRVPYRVEMHIEIDPAEHYARMYRTMLERNPGMDKGTLVLLREALTEAEAASYRLDNLVAAGPGGGKSALVIVNR